MSAEPAINRAEILNTVCATYGLQLDRIEFLAVGTAHVYRLTGVSGRYFLKLLPTTSYGGEAAGRLKREIDLLHVLRDSLPRVPEVLRATQGQQMTMIGGFPACLYRWIEARNVESDWVAALPKLVPLLARLHGATPAIVAAVPQLPMPPEEFELPFAQGLLADLDLLRHLGPEARPALHKLRELLLVHEATLLRLLAQARLFQGAARSRPRALVVCHTDAHGWNVMQDKSGELWLIDWETCRLAPPEHDLWMLEEHLPALLPLYQAQLPAPMALDLEVLGFYFYRRTLEDLSVDIAALLHENTRAEEDEHKLKLVRTYGLSALTTTEQRFQRVLKQIENP